MANLADLQQNPRAALFAMLADVRAGMLGLTATGAGLQPMTHFPDADAGVIWFISSVKTDLVQSLGQGEDADYVVVGKDHDLHASLRGKLYHLHDDAKLDALWSPLVAAWFDGGRDDPDIALLRFEPGIAEVWGATSSSLRFGFEILRANLDPHHTPDIAHKATVRFPTAA